MLKTYSVKQACAALGIGRFRMTNAIRQGQVRAARVGGTWLIDADSLFAMFDKITKEQQDQSKQNKSR